MIDGLKVTIVLPAYNASQTLERTFAEIPMDIVDDVILVDDASTDATAAIAGRLGIHTIIHAGLVLSGLSVLLVLYIAYAWIAGHSIPGWTSLMLVVVVLGAVQMFVLALMGEYIGRLYNEAKQRPLYIVQEVAGGSDRPEARLGYLADATANSDKPGVRGKRPTK